VEKGGGREKRKEKKSRGADLFSLVQRPLCCHKGISRKREGKEKKEKPNVCRFPQRGIFHRETIDEEGERKREKGEPLQNSFLNGRGMGRGEKRGSNITSEYASREIGSKEKRFQSPPPFHYVIVDYVLKGVQKEKREEEKKKGGDSSHLINGYCLSC